MRLSAAMTSCAAPRVLTRGDSAIGEEVAQVREDARRVIRIGRRAEPHGGAAGARGDEPGGRGVPLPAPAARRRRAPRGHPPAAMLARAGLDPLFSVETRSSRCAPASSPACCGSEDGVMSRTSPSAGTRTRRAPLPLLPAPRRHLPRRRAADGARREAPLRAAAGPGGALAGPRLLEDVEGAPAFSGGQAGGDAASRCWTADAGDPPGASPRPSSSSCWRHGHRASAKRGQPAGGWWAPAPSGVVGLRGGPHRAGAQPHATGARSAAAGQAGVPLRWSRGSTRVPALQARAGGPRLVPLRRARRRPRGWSGTRSSPAPRPPRPSWASTCASAPYNDVRVRRALRAGMDIQALVEQFPPGRRVARTLTPPGCWTSRRPPGAPAGPRAGRAAAARGGRAPGAQLTLYFPLGRARRPSEDRLLFRPLVEAGLVELRVRGAARRGYWQRLREGRIAVFRRQWIADYPDPDNFLHFLLNSSAQTVYPLGYRNEELDRLTAEARVSIDPELRTQLYRRAESICQQDCPLVPLYHEPLHAAARPPCRACGCTRRRRRSASRTSGWTRRRHPEPQGRARRRALTVTMALGPAALLQGGPAPARRPPGARRPRGWSTTWTEPPEKSAPATRGARGGLHAETGPVSLKSCTS